MDLWYTENHTDNVRFSVRVERQLLSTRSDFQRIDVFESKEFGRILVLDGFLMLTEKDEFVYHEMISHIPMAVNPSIKNVLVIGAGDGGTLRELTKYATIEKIDVAEIDAQVIEACKAYLPKTACGFDDERVCVHIADGLKFVRSKINCYDLIIVDSTDPFGPGEGLFTKEFYGNCFKALTDNGIMTNQMESPFYPNDAKAAKRAFKRIRSVFPLAEAYQAHIATYPSGHWLFGFASKNLKAVADCKAEAWNDLGIRTAYYNTTLHSGCFCLPTYVKELLYSDD